MNANTPGVIRVRVEPTNPGQFFACCGLLELADRLWDGVEGRFTDGTFVLGQTAGSQTAGSERTGVSLEVLFSAVITAALQQVDPADPYSSPIHIPSPFGLRLDWWADSRSGGDRLKVWAGSMSNFRIASAMLAVLRDPDFLDEGLFDKAMVVFDVMETDKKREPFCFDARRGVNSHPIDIGFSFDPLRMTSAAFPAVEFLCLVGLQRHRPAPVPDRPRVFDYCTWTVGLDTRVAACATCGLLPNVGGNRYRFENAFRTDQRKHKAFAPATPLVRSTR